VSASEKYTAETITWIHSWTPTLFSFRLTRAKGFKFTPGQFARLGVRKSDPTAKDGSGWRIAWRAYSIVSASYDEFLEFYSIVVPDGEFTSELSHLQVGDTVFVEKASYGFLTTDRFEQGRDLWMLSTGTGLAPFLSILAEPSTWEQYEHLVLVHSTREAAELTYVDFLKSLSFNEIFYEHYTKLRYIQVSTRDQIPGVLNARITNLISDGRLEQASGLSLDPAYSRVMLCGNPEMVDDCRKLLATRGFFASRRGQPGTIAVENYW